MGTGNKLKELLKKKNTTVAELSRKTNISAQTLYSIINRDSSISYENLILISEALKVDISELREIKTIEIKIPDKAIEMMVNDIIEKDLDFPRKVQESKRPLKNNSNTRKEEELRVRNDYLLNYFNSEQPFSDEEMEDIKRYAEFVKSKRNDSEYWNRLKETIEIANSYKDKKEED